MAASTAAAELTVATAPSTRSAPLHRDEKGARPAAGERARADTLATSEIQPTRIRSLNDATEASRGRYVLYWMQQSQRSEHNHALELAIQTANELRKPLVVGFGVHERYPEASARHFAFMLEGLSETSKSLERRGIALVARRGRPDTVAAELAKDAAALVCDRGYLAHQLDWRRRVARAGQKNGVRVVEVESDVLVPVEVASDKAEYAARTLRPKLHRRWDEYLVDLRTTPLERPSIAARGLPARGLDLSDSRALVAGLRLNRDVAPITAAFRGGTSQAKARLARFLSEGISSYSKNGKRPETDDVSTLSPYLHFGQISPVAVALTVRGHRGSPRAEKDAFLEELLVRRELACNYVRFTKGYDTFAALPDWAKRTLAKHERDERPHRYTRAQLEAAETHDRYWNAAMREMKATGFLHNYMRMYWGKKILEWSGTPAHAFRTALELNNKYFLDGRDPSSYANVAWLFGLHDRPWQERPIFGTVRYMAASGLERKCDVEAYLARSAERVAEAEERASA